MKKTLALTLAAAMTLSLAACGSSASSAATSTESTSTDTSAATSTAAESGTVENKDKPLVWFNRQPSNSTTGELDTAYGGRSAPDAIRCGRRRACVCNSGNVAGRKRYVDG